MNIFWEHGSMFIRDLISYLPEPRPHYNTVATLVKFLEEKGFLEREPMANTFRYHVKVTEKQYRGETVGEMVAQYYNNSYASLVSQFVEEEKIDLDELKGTWCYVVMPKLVKDVPDSIRDEYLIPREYGFSLKRQWTAQSVGYVREQKSVEDKSPVVYPRLLFFTGWHMLNGQLIVTSGEFGKDEDSDDMKIVSTRNDTCDILYLRDDSLVLGSDGVTRSYYRHTNVEEINREAREKAEKRLKESLGL